MTHRPLSTRRRFLSAVLGVALAAGVLTGVTACGGTDQPAENDQQEQPPVEQPPTEQPPAQEPTSSEEPTASESTPTGEATPPKSGDITALKVVDLKAGTGKEAVAGSTIVAHYTGYFTDGRKFQSSKDFGQPFTAQIGVGRVIPGWDQGIPGMKEGGTRRLYIPSDLAYGEQGSPPDIPGNADLIFDVELIAVQ